jgi:hypothetical protein
MFPPGAWPSGGDDHVISTVSGGATVVAKDPFNGYEFAGWLQLIWGGDPTGEFVESDSGTSGSIGGVGFYDHVIGGAFSAPIGTSADLLASYGYHDDGGIGPFLKFWNELFRERGPFKIPQKGDPGPEDIIRLKILQQLLQETKPGAAGGTDFQGMIEGAARMSREELKRAIQSVHTTLDLGKTALKTLEARLKRGGK